ncbi:hypothetical protein D8674_029952 [Pyrus ussuriensis x Pyrus communis]|uniref:Uncharacterized protein n=1 Tax=Pyrus ussuriensis x Pyrus communis TaxID=2448454 RepID=A0A5N5I0H6_9ROSA|nr:hypothetical protein D8674_029952 [Pyrus ussuriensis x Pyrus communis]
MVNNFNDIVITLNSLPLGRTEKNSPTYLSSGNPCLDFFFHVVPDTPASYICQQLPMAWSHDPLTTLKLICNLRFYTAAYWLFHNHPKTLGCNVASFAEFRYFKDLIEIMYRVLEGPDVREVQKAKWLRWKERSVGVAAASAARVSDLFVDCLKTDIDSLKDTSSSSKYKEITLAAKWCPSLNASFDRSTLLCESIARKLFPRESYPEYPGMEEEEYLHKVRHRLRKEILLPLRKAMDFPEIYIAAKQWDSIPYNRGKFLEYDGERFRKYLEDVKAGKAKIAAGALLQHEIVAQLNIGNYYGQACAEEDYEVASLQWRRIVDDLLKQGKMKNCLAVCDVSESMVGSLMDVSVALGLLVSELNEEPWKGKIITFSRQPQLHLVKGDDFRSKWKFIREMEWGMNTDFQKVFDLILQVAVNGRLKPKHMIKRIFVFSDMEFDQASSNSWETDYEAIQRKFKEKGYEEAVPQIVFWNLRHSSSTPVSNTQRGVALLSGYSKNLMKLFLNYEGEVHPELIMELAISGEEYQSLTVVD